MSKQRSSCQKKNKKHVTKFLQIDLSKMCYVLPLEGENLFYGRLNFSDQFQQRALKHTGFCVNALPESLFSDLKLHHPKQTTLESSSFCSARVASDQQVP